MKMNDRDTWVVFPLVLNLVLVAATFFCGPVLFEYDAVSCTLVAAAVSLISFLTILGFVVHDIGVSKSFLALALQSVLLNAAYTMIYLFRGIGDGEFSLEQAFYFSVVTWTSLGYENVLPDVELMPVTALEAVTGYVFLGLLVSLLAGVTSSARGKASE